MLRLDHRYNNPIFLVFGDIMLERLRMTRVRAVLRKMRRTFLKTKFAREIEERKAEIRAEGGTVKGDHSIRKLELKHKIKLWANRITEFAYDEKNRRCIVVRNKWQLLWRCMQQPYFKRWRDDVRLKRQLEEEMKAGTARAMQTAKSGGTAPSAAPSFAPIPPPTASSAAAAGEVERLRLENESLMRKLAELQGMLPEGAAAALSGGLATEL